MHQHLQRLIDLESKFFALEQYGSCSGCFMKPLLGNVDELVANDATVVPVERGFVVVKHGLKNTEKSFIGHLKTQKDVNYPRCRSDIALMFESIFFKNV